MRQRLPFGSLSGAAMRITGHWTVRLPSYVRMIGDYPRVPSGCLTTILACRDTPIPVHQR